MKSTSRSHVGLIRRINEDRVFDWSDGGIWAVADGMGGHRGGDLAAQSVIDALRVLQRWDGAVTNAAMVSALEDANERIVARNADQGEQAGATVVAACVQGATLHLAWAGDSRCYRVRDGALELLTRDHSVVQELIDAGLLTPEAAARHPQANVITRVLGIAPRCDIARHTVAIATGDRFLLCSDGLSRSLAPTDRIDQATDAAADRLIEDALRRDGSDNISLVLIDPRTGR